jgi:hypothetical protein
MRPVKSPVTAPVRAAIRKTRAARLDIKKTLAGRKILSAIMGGPLMAIRITARPIGVGRDDPDDGLPF